jgi:two-component sensor histidine kinase
MANKTGLYAKFAPRMRLISILMGTFIALTTPLTYFFMNLREEKISADYLGKEVSERIKETVRINPDLWKYSVIKFMKVFDEMEAKEIAAIRIYDEAGEILEQSEFDRSFTFKSTGVSDIVYNNAVFGRVEVDKVVDRTVFSSFSLFLGFCVIGASVAFILFYFPSGIIKAMESKIEDMIERLNIEIVERKTNEEKLEVSLQEEETLLKEVHHRVKNNLQIIASLLGLRINRLTEGETKELLQDLRGKVHAMARVHEQLYQSTSFSVIDMGKYLNTIVVENPGAAGDGAPIISYSVAATDILLSLECAMPIGLIVSELVTNCRKYAFHEREKGRIDIRLEKMEDGLLRLSVRDDGVGMSLDKAQDEGNSLGYLLVKSLAGQLSAKLEVESDDGVKVTIKNIRPA